MSLTKKDFISFFKALSNEDRFQVVIILSKKGELPAQTIERYFYLEQSTVSHHLNLLKRAGIVRSRKDGRSAVYSLDYERLSNIWKAFQFSYMEAQKVEV